MRIGLASDIHLEFTNNRWNDFTPPDVDVMILAGDIGPGVDGITWAKNTFKIPVVQIAGNHEFYGQHSIPYVYGQMDVAADSSNINFLQNKTIEIDGVVFIGATLWTDFNLHKDSEHIMRSARRYLNDYNYICDGDDVRSIITADTILARFNYSKRYIADAVKAHTGKRIVVVTHHAPTERSCTIGGFTDKTNAYYASDLSEFIMDNPSIKLWVHGHVHHAVDYMVGNTRVVCNPRGYQGSGHTEITGFNPHLILEV